MLGRVEAIERETVRLGNDIAAERRERMAQTSDRYTGKEAGALRAQLQSQIQSINGQLDLIDARLERQSERLTDLRDDLGEVARKVK